MPQFVSLCVEVIDIVDIGHDLEWDFFGNWNAVLLKLGCFFRIVREQFD